jgi:hypothetical protein
MTVRIELGADEHVDVKNGASQNLSAALANAQGFIRRIEYLKLFVMQTNVYQSSAYERTRSTGQLFSVQ